MIPYIDIPVRRSFATKINESGSSPEGGSEEDEHGQHSDDYPDDFDGSALFGVGAEEEDDSDNAELYGDRELVRVFQDDGEGGEWLKSSMERCTEHVLSAEVQESEDSGSDYSTTTRERKRRMQKSSRGGDHMETDEEDHELDEEMEGEVDDDEMVHQRSGRGRSRVRTQDIVNRGISRADKGKGRAMPRDAGAEMLEQSQTMAAAAHKLKPGPLSDKAKEEIADFSNIILETADSLAQRHGKTRNDILAAAGLGHVKHSRAVNSANAYRKWYSVHFPKPDDGELYLSLSSQSHSPRS